MNTNTNGHQKREKTKNLIIGLQAVALIAIAAYLFFAQRKSGNIIEEKTTRISSLVTEKSELQGNFDASLAKLDSFSKLNAGLNEQLTDKNEEIASVKAEIRNILNKKNATQSELSQARKLITELNSKISGMEQEIAKLNTENATLLAEKNNLLTEKETLAKDLDNTNQIKNELTQKVDVASTLNASNINIIPVNVRKSGKEIVSAKVNKVDKFLVRFDVSNRIIQAGSTDVFVLVVGPDGQPVTNGETGTFPTREEGEKQFTAKLPIELETAKKQNVEFTFAPGNFKEGNYKVQVYQNGFLIGEGRQSLKKGGLFS